MRESTCHSFFLQPLLLLLRLLLLLLLVAQRTLALHSFLGCHKKTQRGKNGAVGAWKERRRSVLLEEEEEEEEQCFCSVFCIVSKHASLHQLFGVNIFGVHKRIFHCQKSPSRPLPFFPFCVFFSFATASHCRAQRPPRSLRLPYARAVSPDRALCLPTFSHFVIVNKTSLYLSLSPPRHSLLVWSPRLHSSSSSSE